MSDWGAVNARARGLAARQSTPEGLRAARRDGLAGLARLLAARGFPLAAARPTVADLEAAVRAGIGAELRTFDRWLSPDQRRALFAVLGDEDRRSVQRIVRGLAGGASPAARWEGALPTPTLPQRAIEELARQTTPAAVGALLALWEHPLAGAFDAAGARAGRADAGATEGPLALELALDRAFADRAARAARGGGKALRLLAWRWSDATNALTAVVLAGGERELPAEQCFLPGGHVLGRDAFVAAAGTATGAAAAATLAPRFAGELGRALRSPLPERAELEAALLADLLAEQRALARTSPLSAAPTVAWLLGARVEAAALRRAAWSAALGLAEAGGAGGARGGGEEAA